MATKTLKPFKHQQKSLVHALAQPCVYDCSDPGTGKTAVAIWAFEKRLKKKQAKKALVLAPKSLLRSVWANDIKKFAPSLKVSVSTAGKHETAFAAEADVYVTNIDAVKWLAQQPKSFFRDFNELIIDESTAYKHGTSARSKAAAKIAKFFKFRRAMTGTPNGNSITDVWHQVKILDDGKRLGPSFFAFRSAVCTPIQKGPNANALEWVDKDGAEEAVFGMLSDIVVRHKFEDCVDIPEQHQYTVSYQMTPQQTKAYQDMRDHAIAEVYGSVEAYAIATLKGTKPKPLTHVTAINAAAVATKLLQIASGAVYQTGDKYHLIDDARYELIMDLAEARKHALVFFFWNHQKDLLAKTAEKRGMTFAIIDGTVPEHERNNIVTRYQQGQYDVLFAHPRSAAHGLTLTKGTATIWASPTYDLEIFKQGSRRQYRMGQKLKTENIVVVAEDTIDEKAYSSMLVKDARMTNLLDLFSTL